MSNQHSSIFKHHCMNICIYISTLDLVIYTCIHNLKSFVKTSYRVKYYVELIKKTRFVTCFNIARTALRKQTQRDKVLCMSFPCYGSFTLLKTPHFWVSNLSFNVNIIWIKIRLLTGQMNLFPKYTDVNQCFYIIHIIV